AIGAFIAFVIAALKRSLTWEIVKVAVVDSVKGTASIFFIAIGAALLTNFLALSGVPAFMSTLIKDLGLTELELILLISLLYLFLGMFLDPLGCMLLTLPVLLPVLEAQNANLIWFGI